MSPVQTSYYSSQEVGYEGQVIEAQEVGSFWAESAIYPGRAVIQGTSTVATANTYIDKNIPFGVLHPSGSGNTVVGIPILTNNLRNDSNGEPYYYDEDIVAVLKRGSMYVVAGEAVTPGLPVYTVYSVGDSGLALGDLTKDAVAGTTGAAILVPNAYWDSVAAAGAIAKIKIGSDPRS